MSNEDTTVIVTDTETSGNRGAIDRMTKQLVDSGMPSEEARQISVDAAIRYDRKNAK